jgi:hypothetical protein
VSARATDTYAYTHIRACARKRLRDTHTRAWRRQAAERVAGAALPHARAHPSQGCSCAVLSACLPRRLPQTVRHAGRGHAARRAAVRGAALRCTPRAALPTRCRSRSTASARRLRLRGVRLRRRGRSLTGVHGAGGQLLEDAAAGQQPHGTRTRVAQGTTHTPPRAAFAAHASAPLTLLPAAPAPRRRCWLTPGWWGRSPSARRRWLFCIAAKSRAATRSASLLRRARTSCC